MQDFQFNQSDSSVPSVGRIGHDVSKELKMHRLFLWLRGEVA